MGIHINDAALRYLSGRSRTIFEMRQYLLQKGFGQEETEALLAEFISCGYLNDERYCAEYFRYAFGKGKGKRKVFYELREKGVDPALAEIAFEDYMVEEPSFDERERAMEEAEKVLRLAGISQGETVPEKVYGRIGRKLQAKGYGSDVIYSVLGELKR